MYWVSKKDLGSGPTVAWRTALPVMDELYPVQPFGPSKVINGTRYVPVLIQRTEYTTFPGSGEDFYPYARLGVVKINETTGALIGDPVEAPLPELTPDVMNQRENGAGQNAYEALFHEPPTISGDPYKVASGRAVHNGGLSYTFDGPLPAIESPGYPITLTGRFVWATDAADALTTTHVLSGAGGSNCNWLRYPTRAEPNGQEASSTWLHTPLSNTITINTDVITDNTKDACNRKYDGSNFSHSAPPAGKSLFYRFTLSYYVEKSAEELALAEQYSFDPFDEESNGWAPDYGLDMEGSTLGGAEVYRVGYSVRSTTWYTTAGGRHLIIPLGGGLQTLFGWDPVTNEIVWIRRADSGLEESYRFMASIALATGLTQAPADRLLGGWCEHTFTQVSYLQVKPWDFTRWERLYHELDPTSGAALNHPRDEDAGLPPITDGWTTRPVAPVFEEDDPWNGWYNQSGSVSSNIGGTAQSAFESGLEDMRSALAALPVAHSFNIPLSKKQGYETFNPSNGDTLLTNEIANRDPYPIPSGQPIDAYHLQVYPPYDRIDNPSNWVARVDKREKPLGELHLPNMEMSADPADDPLGLDRPGLGIRDWDDLTYAGYKFSEVWYIYMTPGFDEDSNPITSIHLVHESDLSDPAIGYPGNWAQWASSVAEGEDIYVAAYRLSLLWDWGEIICPVSGYCLWPHDRVTMDTAGDIYTVAHSVATEIPDDPHTAEGGGT